MSYRKKAPLQTKTVTIEDRGNHAVGSWGQGKERGRVLRELTRKVCQILAKDLPAETDIHNVQLSVNQTERLKGMTLVRTLSGTATVTYSDRGT